MADRWAATSSSSLLLPTFQDHRRRAVMASLLLLIRQGLDTVSRATGHNDREAAVVLRLRDLPRQDTTDKDTVVDMDLPGIDLRGVVGVRRA